MMHRNIEFFSVASVFLWPVDTPVEGSGVPEGCLRSEMGACRFPAEIEGSGVTEGYTRSHTWLGCSNA